MHIIGHQKLFIWAVFGIIGTLVAGCGGGPAAPATSAPAVVATVQAPTAAPAAKPTAIPELKVTSKELNLFGWSEYLPEDLLKGFEQDFQVKINYDTYASNEEMYAKLQAGSSGYDLVIPSDYWVTIMAKQGLLEKIDVNQIPNFGNLDDPFKNPKYDPGNQYSVPYQWGTVALAINTGQVKDPVTKWADLWDPKYKRKVVLLNDEREVLAMTLLVLGYDINTTDPDQLAKAKEKFKELAPNVQLYDSDSPKTALLSGEAALGMVWNGEAALAHRENPAITYVFPQEGATIWVDNIAIPKGAAHKDAALAFINYMLRPDNSLLITRDFPYSNPNRSALELLSKEDPEAYKGYMDFPATNPPPEVVSKLLSLQDVGDATKIYDQIWTEVKGSE